MNITKDQLPVQQFERLGIQKERLHQLPKDEMHALLSGYPSNMKFLTFKDSDGNMQKVNAKLSIYQSNDGSIGLKVHPYRKEIKNDMDLSSREINKLKSGDSIQKTFKQQHYLVQLDRSINELRRIKVDSIKVAGAVGSVQLSEAQKADLKSGKTISIKNSDGTEKRIKLDLTKPSGITMETPGQKLEKSKTQGQTEQQHIKDNRQQENIRMKR
jgi:hypothetical protein